MRPVESMAMSVAQKRMECETRPRAASRRGGAGGARIDPGDALAWGIDGRERLREALARVDGGDDARDGRERHDETGDDFADRRHGE